MRFLTTKPALGVLAALAFSSLATAQVCPADDVFEPNNDCASATPLSVGATPDLAMEPGTNSSNVPDYYSYTMADGESIVIDVLFIDAVGDLDLRLYSDAACSTQVDSSGTTSDNEQVEYTNTSGGALTVTLYVFPWDAPTCVDYSIDLTSTPPPGCPNPDGFEPNDDCASAAAVTDGSYPTLTRTGPASTVGDSPDYYTISVPALTEIQVDLTFLNANGDIDLYLWDALAGTCTTPMNQPGWLVRGFTGSDNESITWQNASGSAVDYIIGVDAFGSSFDCNEYDMDITFTPLLVPVCPAADVAEPNDDCAGASALAGGLTEDLTLFGQANGAGVNEDFWTYTAVNNESVTIDVLFSDAGGDIDAQLFDDAGCGNIVDSSGSGTDNEQVTFTNTSGGPVTLTLRVYPFGSSFDCNDYQLQVTSVVDPCLSVVEDSFAPNHDCASAASIGAGTYTGLATFKAVAEDFFSIDVPDGWTLNVDVLFATADGDIDCYLYEASTLGTTCGDKSDWIARGFTGSDNENVSWVNTSGGVATYYLQVNLWDSAGNEDCNNYDLVIGLEEPTLGSSMCAGDGSLVACPCGNESADAESGCLNSTGLGAKISATGSNVVADDSVVFHLTQATPSQTAVLVQGTTSIAVPFKDGILCMGTYTRRVQFVSTDASGNASTTGSIIASANLIPGQTRYYQWWHRDPNPGSVCGQASNTSAGLEIAWL